MLLVARRCPPELHVPKIFCRQGSLVFFLSSALYKGGDLFLVLSHRPPRTPKSLEWLPSRPRKKLESRGHYEFRVSRHVFSDLFIFVSQLSKGLFHTPFKRVLGRSRLPVGVISFFLLAKVVLKIYSATNIGKRKHHILSLELNNPVFYGRKGLDSSIKKHYPQKKSAKTHTYTINPQKKNPPLYFRTLGSRLGRSPRD